MTVAVEIRRLSVQDYHRMVEAGILAPDERVELIEGQLYRMAAKLEEKLRELVRLEKEIWLNLERLEHEG